MRGLLTIARQEIAKRWVLLPAALVLGLVPLVLAGFGSYDNYDNQYDGYQNIAAVVQLALVTISYVIAFAIGMGVLGTPLHDGRIAFYFARPVSAIAIVIGKVAGALALIVTVEGLLAMRSLAIRSADQITANLQLEILVGVAFLGAGLVVGILARSKSRWFIADALGAIAVTFEFTKLLDRINIVEMKYRFSKLEKARPLFDQVSSLLIAMLAAAIAAMFVAASVAIVIGRTDQERAHRAMSITLWSSLIAIGAVGFAIGQWGLQ
jgi:hypothetical protein